METHLRIDRDATVTLARGCHVDGHGIADACSGRTYPLNEVGVAVVSRLDGTRTLREVVGELAALYRSDAAAVWTDVVRFLGELDRNSMLAVEPPTLAERLSTLRWSAAHPPAALLWLWMRLMGDDRVAARRYGPDARAAIAAITRSQIVPLGAVLAVSAAGALIAALVWPPRTDEEAAAVRALFLSPLAIVLIHLLVLWAHELGHLVALRGLGVHVRYVYRRGLRVGIAHDRASAAAERCVSLAGPGGALLVGSLISVVLWRTSLREEHIPQVMSVFPLALGLVHVLTLVPWSEDGRHLFARRRRAPDPQRT